MAILLLISLHSLFISKRMVHKNLYSICKFLGSLQNFLRNISVIFWDILRSLTHVCSEFLIFATDDKRVKDFLDQKLPNEEPFLFIMGRQASNEKECTDFSCNGFRHTIIAT